ncbi:tetratricopeptide (TPR) repeat protein [Bacillus horti]|uniref:Tetratricopeptide (TPR) repeat protein n=1 Tax=Caldalkalibacillus horti TaxID=77523 RepID=A0ABT9W561_9BACI|nr:tetratricopeptide (TPR) repeat protein [Bacillus horti]
MDKEWAAMYDLIYLRREKLLTPMEQLDRIEVFKPKEVEMKILKSILKAYIYSDLQERYSIFLHISGTDELIDSLTSTFIKDSFNIRLGLIMSYVYLFENDLEKSREYSYSILNQSFFENVKANAHHNLGTSFLLEGYEKASEHLNKALDFFMYHNQATKVKQVDLNLSFLQSLWNKDFAYTLSLDNHTCFLTYIYYLIKKGESILALEHINRIAIEDLDQWDKAFYFYYKGLLSQDKTDYYYSVEYFSNLNNFFHIQLPLLELKKLGENEVALRILRSRRRK